jgi:hypothetical protein
MHGQLQLVIDAALSSLPRRQTDGAVIVRSQDKDGAKAKAFKLNAQPCEPILIERLLLCFCFSAYLTDLVKVARRTRAAI